MAAEPNLEVQEKAQIHQDLSLMNGDEAFDDNSDEDNVDDENGFLDVSDEFELQEVNVDNLRMLHSGLVEKTTLPVKLDNTGVTDVGNSKTLLLTGLDAKGSDEEGDIDSDEEKKIMKEIRDDIENKIREEMKNELKDYDECMKEVGTSNEPGKTCLGQFEAVSQDDVDPRLQEAMIKMMKLDKILLKKIRTEKEVKRNRILLEKRMRQEISKMTKGVNTHQDIMINTEKFLALGPPASHNEGVTINDEDDDNGGDIKPLFQTQISECEVLWEQDNPPSRGVNGETETNRTESMFKKSSRSDGSKLETKGKKQKTDFIKRNKELAANADQPIAMTDDEKKRLAELLEGVDELSGPEKSVEEDSMNQINSYQLAIHPGEGFCPDTDEMKSLASIDERLKSLMPEDDYQSFIHPSDACSSPVVQQLFNRVGMQTQATGADLPDKYGERMLYETKDERELKARLQSIEQELEKFNAPNEDESPEECHLTDEQLDSLLDQCARYIITSVNGGTPDLSARSIASSRLSLLENPPKLTDEQLQKLLSEVHFPLSSRLLSLKEDDDKSCTEAIRAETWKVIKDVVLDEQAVSVIESPSQINIDQDLESQLDVADIVNLNVSNNHNKNISTNNSEPNNHHQGSDQESEEFEALTSPHRYSAFDHIQTSVYSGSATSSLHGSSSSLPRISHSNGVSRSESYLDNFIAGGTAILLPRESTDDAVRLPNISTKSFLVHTQQGMNNTKEKDRMSLPTKQPLENLCNDLSYEKGDSASGDKEEARGQGYGFKSPGRIISGILPKPPKDRQSKDHQS